MSGTVLEWFESRLLNREFPVSSSAPLMCEVPQGSVLSPPCFYIPLGINISHGIEVCVRCYADDTLLCLSFYRQPSEQFNGVLNWMTCNFLRLNSDETDVIIFAPVSPGKHITTIHQSTGRTSVSLNWRNVTRVKSALSFPWLRKDLSFHALTTATHKHSATLFR